MADWIGTARTNYFRVKDAQAFKNWAAASSLAVIEQDGRYGLYSEDEHGGWPSSLDDESSEGSREFDLVAEIAPHVESGEVVICMEAGAEKVRYISGYALAFRVTAEGVELIRLNLDDIYDLAAQKWGEWPSEAVY